MSSFQFDSTAVQAIESAALDLGQAAIASQRLSENDRAVAARRNFQRRMQEIAEQQFGRLQENSPSEATSAVEDVLAEMRRQTEVEGFGPDHDDTYRADEMGRAAAYYALPAPYRNILVSNPPGAGFLGEYIWPWDPKWMKPTTPRRDRVKAAALLVKDIERMDRATASGRDPGIAADFHEPGGAAPSSDDAAAPVSQGPLPPGAQRLLDAARQLAEYASYAEITGGITTNRARVREFCDVVFAELRTLEGSDIQYRGPSSGKTLEEPTQLLLKELDQSSKTAAHAARVITDARYGESYDSPTPGQTLEGRAATTIRTLLDIQKILAEGWSEELDLSPAARRAVSEDPLLISLLHDLDLLPEQLTAQKEVTPGLVKAFHRLYGIVYLYGAIQSASNLRLVSTSPTPEMERAATEVLHKAEDENQMGRIGAVARALRAAIEAAPRRSL